MSRSETKSQLKQRVEELKRQLTDSQRRLSEEESAREELKEAKEAQRQLKEDLQENQQKPTKPWQRTWMSFTPLEVKLQSLMEKVTF